MRSERPGDLEGDRAGLGVHLARQPGGHSALRVGERRRGDPLRGPRGIERLEPGGYEHGEIRRGGAHERRCVHLDELERAREDERGRRLPDDGDERLAEDDAGRRRRARHARSTELRRDEHLHRRHAERRGDRGDARLRHPWGERLGVERAEIERRGRVERVARADQQRAKTAADRLGREEIVQPRIPRAPPGPRDGRRAPLDRRERSGCQARAVLLPAKLVDRLQHLEQGRGDAPRGQRSPRVGRRAVQEDVHGRHLPLPLVELRERAQRSHVARELAACRLEGLLRLPQIARRGLVDRRDLDETRRAAPSGFTAIFRSSCSVSSARGRVALATVYADEPLERGHVFRRPLEHFLQRHFGARQIDGVLRVELAEARVDALLIVRIGDEPREAHPRLLGGLPVLERRAEIGVGRERDDVIGLRLQRRFERAARGERLADGHERLRAVHLQADAVLVVRRRRQAPLEEPGELPALAALRVDGAQTR